MTKNYITLFLVFLFSVQISKAQCPRPSGMVVTPLTLSGLCFLNIQYAIPNSNVSVYNDAGLVAQGTANATGNVVLTIPCGSVTASASIVSIQASPLQICNTYIWTGAGTLPIKLVSFAATVTASKTALLKWVSSIELHLQKYEIQKSTDAANFTTIGTLTPNNEGLGNKSYIYEDATFTAGATAFYRLKDIDQDGKGTYSRVVYLSDKTSSTNDYSLFPNPVTASNTIQVKGIAAQEVNTKNIRVMDLTGRNYAFTITSGNTITLAANAPAGVYLVKIKDKVIKLLKQ